MDLFSKNRLLPYERAVTMVQVELMRVWLKKVLRDLGLKYLADERK